jgi:hypothetical protein
MKISSSISTSSTGILEATRYRIKEIVFQENRLVNEALIHRDFSWVSYSCADRLRNPGCRFLVAKE